MKEFVSFPWKLFLRMNIVQCLFLLIGLISVKIWSQFSELNVTYESSWLFVIGAWILGSLLFLYNSYRILNPLNRVLIKAKSIIESPFSMDKIDDSFSFNEDSDEWYHIEKNLNEISKKYRDLIVQYSREKGELRALMNSVQESILAIDSNKRPLFFNKEFAFSFNIEKVDNWSLDDVLRSSAVDTVVENCWKEKKELQMDVNVHLVGDNKNHIYHIKAVPLVRKPDGLMYGILLIFRDKTEEIKNEKSRLEFVTNASHELRTPLTKVIGYFQAMKEDLNNHPSAIVQKGSVVIEKNLDHMKQLADDLLDLAVIDSNKELKIEKIELAELTNRVLSLIDTSEHQVELNCEVTHMYGDKFRVEQVLRNLIENAVKYVPKNEQIKIVWKQNQNHVTLVVSDSGNGLPDNELTKVFERYYRASGKDSDFRKGSGIGLSLVKHIVLLHGGNVSARNVNGKGAEFCCEFPQSAV